MTNKTIRQVCSGCGAASRLPAQLAGASLLCSGCGSDVQVSMPARQSPLRVLRAARMAGTVLSLLFIAFATGAWYLQRVDREDVVGEWEGTRVVDGEASRLRLELRPDNTFYLRVHPDADVNNGEAGGPPGASWMDGRWEVDGQSLVFHVGRSSAGIDPDPEFVWDVDSADRGGMTTDTSAGRQVWQRATQVSDVSDVGGP